MIIANNQSIGLKKHCASTISRMAALMFGGAASATGFFETKTHKRTGTITIKSYSDAGELTITIRKKKKQNP